MRLQRLELINFRGFKRRTVQLNPGFNLIIGENGAGKTSILEAIAVALIGWLQGFPRPAFAHLETAWTNFLLACVNCNSTKGHQSILLDDVLFPDRDNTFLAYEYTIDGRVRVTPRLASALAAKAQALLTLTGLDRKLNSVLNENSKQIVVDRVSARAEIMVIALDQVAEIAADPSNQGVERSTVRMACATGGFSVWMAAFAGDADMQERLIDAFAGTRASDCFGTAGHTTVSPHPNTDGLSSGGRI